MLVASMLQSNPTLVTKSVARANVDTDGVLWNVDENTIETAEADRLQRAANTTRHEYELHKTRWGEGELHVSASLL